LHSIDCAIGPAFHLKIFNLLLNCGTFIMKEIQLNDPLLQYVSGGKGGNGKKTGKPSSKPKKGGDRPDVTTLAVGEEGGQGEVTTMAIGEESGAGASGPDVGPLGSF
jgi:hypothetical protein